MPERPHNPPGQYRMRTRLIHSNRENIRWDFDDHTRLKSNGHGAGAGWESTLDRLGGLA